MNAVFRIRIRRDLALLDLDPDPVETKLTNEEVDKTPKYAFQPSRWLLEK
jgi:hypothetical protein